MVGLGVGYNGAGTLHTVEKNLKINGDVYMDMVRNAYQAGCCELFGDDYVFQQDNAPAHTKKEVKAWLGTHVPAMMDPWPACSPDLNALDFAVRGILAQWVDDAVREQNISTEVGLKVAIRATVAELRGDLALAQRRVMGFPRRVRACIEAGGGHFEHKEKVTAPRYEVGANEIIVGL